MLRQIYIDKYNKIAKTFKSEIFNSLTVLQTRPYNSHVDRYLISDQHQELYHLYRTDQQLEPILEEVPFIENSPKILMFPCEKDTIIIEEKTQENLYEYLLNNEDNSQYISLNEDREVLARRIIRNLRLSLTNYKENNVNYNAINPKNIVRKAYEWEFSLVGLLLKNQKESDDYYKTGISKEFRDTYALGTLLFKLIFGFVPFEQKKQFNSFSFKDYPKHLDREQTKKYLKVYAYAEGMLEVSPIAKGIIQSALSGKMTLQEFYNHRYFEQDGMLGSKKEINPATKEIKMLSLFSQSHQSLILAAIQHKKKYPHQRLNSQLKYAHQLTKEETISYLSKHSVLCEMEFDVNFKDVKDKGFSKVQQEFVPLIDIPYFYKEDDFDCELDKPCVQLFKLVEHFKVESHLHDQQSQQFQAKIKMYAFPYAVVFQLAKVAKEQPIDIQKKIRNLSEDLLQISQLHYFKKMEPLHKTNLIIKEFDDIKIRFRQQLNELYKHFLGEAIKRYNVKKEVMSYQERSASKAKGLEYYKICLKLMECSVLNRKKGRDLDLNRMQTSTRKEVEMDLDQLLKQYFPNKIEHF